ncbi:MAG: PQQ-binding-like beta-propeller repeat protein [Verrucomicrobiota bacterium]
MKTNIYVKWVGLAGCLLATAVIGEDWPQFMGPRRDSVWHESGVVTQFPATGLPIKWRTPIAGGYSGPAVAGGKVYVMDYAKQSGEAKNNSFNVDEMAGVERVLCFDAATGKRLWLHEYPRPYKIAYGSGPRCTPTVEGNRVYALGAEGNFWCLDAGSGQVVWSKDFTKDYDARTAVWGYASHPLMVGDTVICAVGQSNGVLVAFDKATGRERWRALPASTPGYGAPTLIEHQGKPQLLFWHGDSLNSLNPERGTLNWSYPLKPSYGMAIAAPRQDGDLLYVSSYSLVGALLKLKPGAAGVELVWKGQAKNALYSGTATPFLEGEHIYGCDVETGTLMCIRREDGERVWQTTAPTTGEGKKGRYGTAFLVKHEDRFFLFNELGDLMLARLSPKGYEEISRFHVLDASNKAFGRAVVWSHPAFAKKCLFARNDRELVCVDLAATGK